MAEQLEGLAHDVHGDARAFEQRRGVRGRLTEQLPHADHRRERPGQARLAHDLSPDRDEIIAAVAVHAERDGASVHEAARRHGDERRLADASLSVDHGVLPALCDDVEEVFQLIHPSREEISARDGCGRTEHVEEVTLLESAAYGGIMLHHVMPFRRDVSRTERTKRWCPRSRRIARQVCRPCHRVSGAAVTRISMLARLRS